jgi:hypothetical protein
VVPSSRCQRTTFRRGTYVPTDGPQQVVRFRWEFNTSEEAITASYDKGILTVSMPVTEPKPAEKHVTIESAD